MYLDSSLSCFTPCESGHVGRSATGISDLPKGRWATNEKDTTLANFAWLDGGPRSYYRVSDGPVSTRGTGEPREPCWGD